MAQGLVIDPTVLNNLLKDVTADELATAAKILTDLWLPESAGVQKVGRLLWDLHHAKASATTVETLTLALPTMRVAPGPVTAAGVLQATLPSDE